MSLRGRHARTRSHDGRLRKHPTELVRVYYTILPMRSRVTAWVERLRLFL